MAGTGDLERMRRLLADLRADMLHLWAARVEFGNQVAAAKDRTERAAWAGMAIEANGACVYVGDVIGDLAERIRRLEAGAGAPGARLDVRG